MGRFDLPPGAEQEIAFKELVLERMKIAGQGRISAHVLHSTEFATWADPMTDSLAIRLTTEVLAERVLDTEEHIDWNGEGTARVKVRTRGLLLPFVVAGAVCFAGIAAESLLVIVASFLAAIVASVLLYLNPSDDVDVTVPVGGTVVVPATYWRKFPEVSTVYPKEMGRPVRFAVINPPSFRSDE